MMLMLIEYIEDMSKSFGSLKSKQTEPEILKYIMKLLSVIFVVVVIRKFLYE